MNFIALACFLGSLSIAPPAIAQIQPLNTSGWSDQFALPGPNSDVSTVAVSNDYIYVGGFFSYAGSTPAENLARWNRTTQSWEEVGGGLSLSNGAGNIQALEVGGAGELYVAGSFVEPGGDFFQKIAKWDGESWHVLGESLDPGSVADILYSGGVLYAAGAIPVSDGSIKGVVQWDGNSWIPLGDGTSGTAQSMVVDSDGRIYAGGSFSPDGNIIFGVAQWDGNSWSYLDSWMEGSTLLSPFVWSLSILGDQLFVAGNFDTFGGISSNNAVRWDSQGWHALSFSAVVYFPQIAVLPSGEIVLASGSALYAWDGQAWSFTGLPIPFDILSMEPDGDDLIIGGVSAVNDFSPPQMHIFRYDGSELNVIPTKGANGVSGPINALASDDQYIYAGGSFNFTGALPVQNVARWDGTTWDSLGAGLDGTVLALAHDSNGLLYAGGFFTASDSVALNHIAVWDGVQWKPLGGGVDGVVQAISIVGDSVYVGGGFTSAVDESGTVSVSNLAIWDGSHWHDVGGGLDGSVSGLAFGDVLYVGGSFDPQGSLLTSNSVRAWDGVAWTKVGNDFGGPVWTVAWHDGTLYAGGNFDEAFGSPGNGIVRWDGNAWQPLGTGTQGPNTDVQAIAFSDQGDLYATGYFSSAGGASASLVARWDGAQWHALDGGLLGVNGMAVTIRDREVYVGGAFSGVYASLTSEVFPSTNFAHWTMPLDLPVEAGAQLPASLKLNQNYPNPFNGRTTISYTLPHPSHVSLEVFDLLGRRVSTLVSAWQNAGAYEIEAELDLPSGVYISRLSTDHGIETRKMMLLR